MWWVKLWPFNSWSEVTNSIDSKMSNQIICGTAKILPIVSLPSIQCHRYHFLEPHTILCRETVQRHPSSESKAHKHPIPHHEVKDFIEGPMSNTLTQAPPLNAHSNNLSEDNYWIAINIASRPIVKNATTTRLWWRFDHWNMITNGKWLEHSMQQTNRPTSVL